MFTLSKKGDYKLKNGELGSGRAKPIRQGYLYKDWKMNYFTPCDDGRLTFHSSLPVSSL